MHHTVLSDYFSKLEIQRELDYAEPCSGCQNPGMDTNLETFALVKRVKDSAGRPFTSLTIGPARLDSVFSI